MATAARLWRAGAESLSIGGMHVPSTLGLFVGRAAGLAAALATGLAAALACGSAVAEPQQFVLDPDHSFVHFEVLHFGTSTLRGRFGPVSGSVLLDRAAQRGAVSLRIATTSLNTGVPILDARLRQPDLLATEANPEAYFVATRFRFEAAQLAELRGEFTFRGVSQPLSLRALRFACRTDDTAALPAEVCGGDFEGSVLRSEFSASFGLPFVADRVRLLVQVEGRRPLGPPARTN